MNITLIGMAGAGKSYTGRALAKKLGYKFLDIDLIIESKLKKGLHDVVRSIGDREFVRLEEKTILSLKNLKNTVISPGGSVVYSKKAVRHLRKLGPVVFLKTPFSVIRERVPDMNARGLIKFKHKTLRSLYLERLPLYEKSSHLAVSMPKGVKVSRVLSSILKVLLEPEFYS